MASIFKKLKKKLQRATFAPKTVPVKRQSKTKLQLQKLEREFEVMRIKAEKAIEVASNLCDLKNHNQFLEAKLTQLTLRVQELESSLAPTETEGKK